MATKNLRTYFYTLSSFGAPGAVAEVDYLWNLFINPALYQNGVSTIEALNSQTGKACELREVVQVGSVIKGCLALLREDAPTLRRSDGNEAPLPMADGDRIIEKNYFLYFRDTRLLVWQFNMAANHVANLGLMLSTLGGLTRVVSYTHVLKSLFAFEADQIIEYVDLKVSEPRNKSQRNEVQQLDPRDWSFNPFKVLSDTGSRQLEVVMQNRTADGLKGSTRRLLDDLTGLSATRKLRVKVDGAAEAIDLLAERYTYKVPMHCAVANPSATEILQALQQAKDLYDAEQAQSNTV